MDNIPEGYCQCGCGQQTRLAPRNEPRFGWIKGKPRKFINGHNRRSTPLYHVEEDRGHDTPCWIWQRYTQPKGYGVTYIKVNNKPKTVLAHRLYFEREYGSIPHHLELDHLCRVRNCVNPDHLEPVTHAENIRRGARWHTT